MWINNTVRSRVEELESYSIITKRVEMLVERSHMNHVQYNRRESIEIDGIPTSVCDEDLENTTLTFSLRLEYLIFNHGKSMLAIN